MRSGAWFFKGRKTARARGVVVSSGTTARTNCSPTASTKGSLPRLSHRLGSLVRTNSEAILAVTAKDDSVDYSTSVAISSSFFPDENTHIENVTYGHGGDAMGRIFTLLTGEGTAHDPADQVLRHGVMRTRSPRSACSSPTTGRAAR